MKYLDVCSEIIFHVLIWKSCASQSFLLLRLLKKVAISLGKIYAKKPGSQAQQYLNYKYYKTYVTRRLLLSFQGSRTMNPTGIDGSRVKLPSISLVLFCFCDMKLRPKLYKMLNRETHALQCLLWGTIYISFVAKLESGALCSLSPSNLYFCCYVFLGTF